MKLLDLRSCEFNRSLPLWRVSFRDKKEGEGAPSKKEGGWLAYPSGGEEPSLARRLQRRRYVGLILGKIHIVQFPTQCLPVFLRDALHANLDVFTGWIEYFIPIIPTQGFRWDDFFQLPSFIEYAYWIKHGVLPSCSDAGIGNNLGWLNRTVMNLFEFGIPPEVLEAV